MGMQYVQNFEGCIVACDTTAGCVDVSLSGTACYLKSSLGAPVVQAGIEGARLLSTPAVSSAAVTSTPAPSAPTCPASNGTTFVANSGAVFLIECAVVSGHYRRWTYGRPADSVL